MEKLVVLNSKTWTPDHTISADPKTLKLGTNHLSACQKANLKYLGL